jgi:hypothetical protein
LLMIHTREKRRDSMLVLFSSVEHILFSSVY